MLENVLLSIGSIIKKESLISIDFQTKCKSLILESEQPFPGYHGTTLPKSEPDSMYFVTKTHYSDEKIIRTIQQIKKEHRISFDGTPGTITLTNKQETVIRIKQAKYNIAPQLSNLFVKHGFAFAKYRKIAAFNSIINIRKYFKIDKIFDNIYHDLQNKPMYYLQIPSLPEWTVFEEITKNIKYNIEDNNFDAALCSMYNEDGLIDFVRIYDENSQIEKMKYIHEKYLIALSKY